MPGHTPGHVAFFPVRDRMLRTGDAVLTVELRRLAGLGTRYASTTCYPAASYTNWRQDRADASLAELAAMEPSVLASGHGPRLVGDVTTRKLHVLAERNAARHRTVAAGR